MLTAFDENDVYAYKRFYSGRQGSLSAPTLSVTYDRYADQAVPVAPANGAVVNTLTPTLIVQPGTDPDAGDIVQFWHRLTTTPDAESGAHLVDSGWRYPGSTTNPNTHFKVPEGVLADGVTYYWQCGATTGPCCGPRTGCGRSGWPWASGNGAPSPTTSSARPGSTWPAAT